MEVANRNACSNYSAFISVANESTANSHVVLFGVFLISPRLFHFLVGCRLRQLRFSMLLAYLCTCACVGVLVSSPSLIYIYIYIYITIFTHAFAVVNLRADGKLINKHLSFVM